jgi:hypothetical protein
MEMATPSQRWVMMQRMSVRRTSTLRIGIEDESATVERYAVLEASHKCPELAPCHACVLSRFNM